MCDIVALDRTLIAANGTLDARNVTLSGRNCATRHANWNMGGETPMIDDPKQLSALLYRAQLALGMTQAEFGELIGVSRRTIIRWSPNASPIPQHLHEVARAVHPLDSGLAAEVAVAAGTTLEALGVLPATPPMQLAHLVDSIVCAAAEAAGTTPQAIRPALSAALERAEAMGVTVDQVKGVLKGARGGGQPGRPKETMGRRRGL